MPAGESPEYRRLAEEMARAQAGLTRQLEQSRRRHSHRLRRQPGRFRSDPGIWMIKWIVFPAAAVFLLAGSAVQSGPALAAAKGHGTAGYFVAETENCSKDGCNWTGNFVTPDGRVTHRDAGFKGPHGTFYQGARLPAPDAGDAARVHARHGSRDWMGDLAGIVVGVTGTGLWAWRFPYRTARRWACRNRVAKSLLT